MICSKCNAENENDSRFCSECGAEAQEESQASPGRKPRQYVYALLLIPVVLIAAGIGYYKFFLPEGIAAVVNGEEIRLSELDAAVIRTAGASSAADPRLRYQILNTLINERLALQEAHRSGMVLSAEEVKTAVERARAASGLDDRSFEERLVSEYGSMQDFERAVERSLLVNRFIAEKVVPANSDARTARAAVDRWLQDRTAAASVRVTLAEQWSGAGCGCCSNKSGPQAGSQPGNAAIQTAKNNAGAPATGKSNAPEITRAGQAAEAARRYWSEKHGVQDITTEVTDFGCHMQVDIIKNNKKVGSLRYQGGSVSEL